MKEQEEEEEGSRGGRRRRWLCPYRQALHTLRRLTTNRCLRFTKDDVVEVEEEEESIFWGKVVKLRRDLCLKLRGTGPCWKLESAIMRMQSSFCSIAFIIALTFLCFCSVSSYLPTHHHSTSLQIKRSSGLTLSSQPPLQEQEEEEPRGGQRQPLVDRHGGRRGYYVRPSAAIERGGGFFVPGLEGDKIRLASALLLLLLLLVNGIAGSNSPLSDIHLVVSSAIGAMMASWLLAQGLAGFLPPPAAARSGSGGAAQSDQDILFFHPSLAQSPVEGRIMKAMIEGVEAVEGVVVVEEQEEEEGGLYLLAEWGSASKSLAEIFPLPLDNKDRPFQRDGEGGVILDYPANGLLRLPRGQVALHCSTAQACWMGERQREGEKQQQQEKKKKQIWCVLGRRKEALEKEQVFLSALLRLP
eukprot:scaffold61_cov180-Ochromonas_danica.AAC.18